MRHRLVSAIISVAAHWLHECSLCKLGFRALVMSRAMDILTILTTTSRKRTRGMRALVLRRELEGCRFRVGTEPSSCNIGHGVTDLREISGVPRYRFVMIPADDRGCRFEMRARGQNVIDHHDERRRGQALVDGVDRFEVGWPRPFRHSGTHILSGLTSGARLRRQPCGSAPRMGQPLGGAGSVGAPARAAAAFYFAHPHR